MLHEPAAEHGVDQSADYKKRLGLIMLAVYTAIYLAFILINVIKPTVMGVIVFAGLNLAIIYGFVLIVSSPRLGPGLQLGMHTSREVLRGRGEGLRWEK